ncbi:MAG: hypothetical protein RLZ35_1292 [Pseudomonadota bacterium]|jgi:squalene-associated FAD-dependent desaturase
MGSLENMATVSTNKPVIVVGGGWAGLSCAHTLSTLGQPVILLEAAPQCGGRARSVVWKPLDIKVDNGQHILLGAYRSFLGILDNIGIQETKVLNRYPFEFLATGQHKHLSFVCKKRPYIPYILSLGIDLYQAQGLRFQEKYQLGSFLNKYIFRDTPISRNLSVLALLKMSGQSDTLIQYFWEPLLVAALSTPLHEATAQYAIRVLKDSFAGKDPHTTDILIPSKPLGDIFAEPVSQWLSNQGHTVLCNERVTGLYLSDSGQACIGVRTKHHTFFGDVVLALPPRATATLIKGIPALSNLEHKLKQLSYQPIITIYYAYPRSINDALPIKMQAKIEDKSHYWLLSHTTENHLIFSAVFSGNGSHLNTDKNTLMDLVQTNLEIQYPALQPLIARKHIQEKFAAFSANTVAHQHTFEHQTALPGLWICGDYTDPAYPATLEGAVRSGVACGKSVYHF